MVPVPVERAKSGNQIVPTTAMALLKQRGQTVSTWNAAGTPGFGSYRITAGMPAISADATKSGWLDCVIDRCRRGLSLWRQNLALVMTDSP